MKTDLDADGAWRPMAVRAAVCLVGAVTAWITLPHSPTVAGGALVIAYFSGAWDLAHAVWADLRERRFNTEFLMLLVALGAASIGAWQEGALLLVLFSASAAMEAFAAGRTEREIRSLLKGAPKTARRLDGEQETEVPVDALQPGDRVRVTANEQFPVDLEVVRGESASDEATLTGEAEPVSKRPGDTALAGTLNLWGVLEGKVLRVAGDSALQRIIGLIHEAQQQKAPVQRFTDRFGTGYTAGVLGACLVWFFINWLFLDRPVLAPGDGQTSALYRAMTLLVVLSPCALVLSVPSAILSAIAAGARRGVLFRGGAAVERLAEVEIVALDKTGTLTEGILHLEGADVLEGAESDARAAAVSLAALSNHPVSRAVALELRRAGVEAEPVEGSETVPARGLRGVWRGGKAALGNREWMEENGVPASRMESLPPLSDGASATWVMAPGLLARFRLRDRLRVEAASLIAQLHRSGLRTVMLTGDREAAAERMATAAGLTEFRARLTPEGKVAAVRSLKEDGSCVAMIGDGVNDAPVLAVADVGLAMGARGSDAALEVADVVLMNDRLENVLVARQLSVRARSVIRQNLVISLGTMAVMAVVTVTATSLPLSVGVAAHEGSTVIVVLNSLRLLFPGRLDGRSGMATPGVGRAQPQRGEVRKPRVKPWVHGG